MLHYCFSAKKIKDVWKTTLFTTVAHFDQLDQNRYLPSHVKYGIKDLQKKLIWAPCARDVHSCTHWLRPRNPPPPRIWAHIRGRSWSAKIDDFSL